MKLEPLYRVRFRYPEGWSVALGAGGSLEGQHFFLAEGRCTGRVAGRLRGANHPHRRSDGTFEPDFQGVITTDEGAVIYFDYRGYGRTHPPGRRQIVATATHLTEHDRYRWLNEGVAVGVGEVRTLSEGVTELVIEWKELVWEPPAEDP
ncbi:MAG: DUF3237 domain-containing protein [Candidatus Eisenbacteria bacterium]|uniref:DUF3237 domain-containing protein n=1 Tax=Eiseniibacteriota bacterium TaxID=2212470 RepID=A0A538SAW1_UNCEI|nr:MAG: DUF3237 domain-containing protein [Candidatus Eisenbacteria bacterium]